MSGRFSLEHIFVQVVMEFQRAGLPSVRKELADQCAFEVCVAMSRDPEFAALEPEVHAWRCYTTEDGKDWHYPDQELLGESCCRTDSRHVGGSEFEQLGVRTSLFQALTKLQEGNLALEALVSRTIRPLLLEELTLRYDYEKDVQRATAGVTEEYKQRQQERFQSATTAGAT